MTNTILLLFYCGNYRLFLHQVNNDLSAPVPKVVNILLKSKRKSSVVWTQSMLRR